MLQRDDVGQTRGQICTGSSGRTLISKAREYVAMRTRRLSPDIKQPTARGGNIIFTDTVGEKVLAEMSAQNHISKVLISLYHGEVLKDIEAVTNETNEMNEVIMILTLSP